MTFPSGTISADDIRAQLAYNNTAGAQTPVTLNDLPVRQAADKLTGTVSYNDLRGKNVMFSGLVTWGENADGLDYYWGYEPYVGAGSINTASYCRYCSINGSSTPTTLPSIALHYIDNIGSSSTQIVTDNGASLYPTPTSLDVNVYIDGTKYSLTATSFNYNNSGWYFSYQNPLNLDSRSGQTNQVVITYT
jgi:hypothetical protein